MKTKPKATESNPLTMEIAGHQKVYGILLDYGKTMKSVMGEEVGLHQKHMGLAFTNYEAAYAFGDYIYETSPGIHIVLGHVTGEITISSNRVLITSNNIEFNEIIKSY